MVERSEPREAGKRSQAPEASRLTGKRRPVGSEGLCNCAIAINALKQLYTPKHIKLEETHHSVCVLCPFPPTCAPEGRASLTATRGLVASGTRAKIILPLLQKSILRNGW